MKRSAKEQKEQEEEFYENSQQGKITRSTETILYIYLYKYLYKYFQRKR